MNDQLDKETIVRGLNNWLEDCTKNPDAFESFHNTCLEFLHEKLDGAEPSYGQIGFDLIKAYGEKK